MRPTWAEVNLPALQHNFHTLQKLVGPQTTVCGVIKADAYGHGSPICAKALEAAGAEWLGVTSTEEGAQVRDIGVNTRLLLMTGFWHGEEDEVVARQMTPAVWDPWHIESLQQASAKRKANTPVHLKVDTGMTRFGVNICDLEQRLEQITSSPDLELEGVFSHLASAEVIGADDVEAQREAFCRVRDTVLHWGFRPRYFHIANTAATISRPDARLDMVRPGLALYGYSLRFATTTAGVRGPEFPVDLKPALAWKTRIISMREVDAGRAVGYGGTFTTTKRTRIAGLPIGYADGLDRRLSSRGQFIVRDRYAPILGRVSMDITLVDVTEIPDAQVGDEVLVIGSTPNCTVSAWDHAHLAETIAYDILCAISERVPRVAVHE
jgi:alanine racemase